MPSTGFSAIDRTVAMRKGGHAYGSRAPMYVEVHSRQENDELDSDDGADEDEDLDFEEDGEAGTFGSEDSGTREDDEESEYGGEAELLHCSRCKTELDVNNSSIITYCLPCADGNLKEMNMLGSSVVENLKIVASLKEQLGKVMQIVAGLRQQIKTREAENLRLTMELKVAKLEARDAKKLLCDVLVSRKRPLQRPSSKAPLC